MPGCASAPRIQVDRVPAGSLRLAQVIALGTREQVLEDRKSYDLLLESGISDAEINGNCVGIGRVYCCGGLAEEPTATAFYVPPGIQVNSGDIVEVRIGYPPKKGEPGRLNTVTQVRQRAKDTHGSLQ